MKMLKKYAYLLSLVAVAFGFAACSDDDGYTPGQPVNEDCQQVYFPSSNQSEVVLTPDEVAAGYSFNVTVVRNFAYAAASIPIKVIEAPEGVFEIPETIEFLDGERETSFPVAVSNTLTDGEYTLSIGIEGDEYVDPYTQFDGHIYYSIKVSVEAWENLGMATIRDDYMTAAFNVPISVWQCECWTRSTMPGYICLKNAWTSTYPLNEPGDYQEEDHWFYVNIADPDAVIIPSQKLGFDWGYGEFMIFMLQGGEGKLVDGVITFPVKGLAMGMVDYTSGEPGFYANGSGLFAIALPGYEIPQPEEPDTPVVDPDAEPANIIAQLFTFSSVLPSYSAQYPDHTSLCGIIMGEDIVSGGYALLKGDLEAYEMVSGEAVKSVVDALCAGNNITEDQLFDAFGDDYYASINGDGCALAFANLNAATYYTLFVKGINSNGGVQYVAHTYATSAAPSAVPATGSYVRKSELEIIDGVKAVKLIR